MGPGSLSTRPKSNLNLVCSHALRGVPPEVFYLGPCCGIIVLDKSKTNPPMLDPGKQVIKLASSFQMHIFLAFKWELLEEAIYLSN